MLNCICDAAIFLSTDELKTMIGGNDQTPAVPRPKKEKHGPCLRFDGHNDAFDLGHKPAGNSFSHRL